MKFLIWVVVLLYQDSLALAQTLRVGLLDFPPFSMESEEEYLPVRGVIAERLVKALGTTGLKYDIKIYPAKRLFLYFKNNTLDFIIPSQSQIKRFKDIAVFSDKPILNLQLRAYSYSKDISV